MTQTPSITDEEALADIVRGAKTVAVLGMKDESSPHVPAYEIPQLVQQRGIRVIPINPRIKESLGEKAYADLASIPEPYDILNIFRGSQHIPAHAKEILVLPPEKRPKIVWLQTGIINEEAAEKLSAAGIQVVMDRCLGVYASRYLR